MRISNYLDCRIVVSAINEKTKFKKRYFYSNTNLKKVLEFVKKSSLQSSNIFYVYEICSSMYVFKVFKGKTTYIINKKEFQGFKFSKK